MKLHFIEQEIQKDCPDFWAGYGYVSNAAGGFYGFWMGQELDIVGIFGTPLDVYLQYQIYPGEKEDTTAELCLKISQKDPANPNSNFDKAKNWIIYGDGNEYRLEKYHFSRPQRISSGKSITIGKYCAKLDTYEQLMIASKSAIADYERLMKDIE